ncbi:replication initiation protein [Campylobacter upsaliensis]|nr:replication initiation protein [Campylobacter upsaliensis]EAL3926166.1 replication initiation protein [Campylobacter upsaliensis]MCR2095675.1 replication initiation protein [Campylobacter upsaliensis]
MLNFYHSQNFTIQYQKKDIKYIEENPTISYHNNFYNFIFTNFNAKDYNFLMTLFYFFKEKRNIAIEINTLYLSSFMDKKIYNKKRTVREFKSFVEKAMKIYIKTNYEEKTSYFNLFNSIHIDEKRGNFYIVLDQNIIEILNDINSFYTKFFLKEFYALNGKYSKIIYLLLISFQNKTSFQITKNDFYKYLDLSSSYERKDNFETRIIKPAFQEIETKSCFKNISYKEIKNEKEIHFIFYFQNALKKEREK